MSRMLKGERHIKIGSEGRRLTIIICRTDQISDLCDDLENEVKDSPDGSVMDPMAFEGLAAR